MKKITTFLLIFLMTFCFIGKVSAANRKVKLIPENQFDYGEIIDWAKTFGNYKALCVYEIKSDIPYDGFDTGWKAVIRNYDYHFIFLVTNDDDLEYTGIQKAVGYDGDSIDGNLNFKIYGEQWIKDNIDKLSLKKLSKNKNDFQKFLGVTADNFKKSDGYFCPKFYIAVINDSVPYIYKYGLSTSVSKKAGNGESSITYSDFKKMTEEEKEVIDKKINCTYGQYNEGYFSVNYDMGTDEISIKSEQKNTLNKDSENDFNERKEEYKGIFKNGCMAAFNCFKKDKKVYVWTGDGWLWNKNKGQTVSDHFKMETETVCTLVGSGKTAGESTEVVNEQGTFTPVIIDVDPTPMTCEEILGTTLTKVVRGGITIIQIVCAVIAIINGMTMLIPAVVAKDASELQKAGNKLYTMAIILALVIIFRPFVRIIGMLLGYDVTCIV